MLDGHPHLHLEHEGPPSYDPLRTVEVDRGTAEGGGGGRAVPVDGDHQRAGADRSASIRGFPYPVGYLAEEEFDQLDGIGAEQEVRHRGAGRCEPHLRAVHHEHGISGQFEGGPVPTQQVPGREVNLAGRVEECAPQRGPSGGPQHDGPPVGR